MSWQMHERLRKFEEWLASPEGQKEWDEAFAEVAKMSEELKKARRLSRETLHTPMTI